MITCNRLSHNFGASWALKDVSFSLEKGQFLFLTGRSGAGKTTLMRLLYAALPVMRGQASVAGYELKGIRSSRVAMLRREVGVVFQDFKILPQRSVFDNVACALEVRLMERHLIEKRVRAVLRVLRIEEKAYVPAGQLSGGEQQRVAIARSVVVNPKLILADEPTGNLDPELSSRLMEVFRQFHTYGTTVVMATHNLDTIKCIPDARTLHLEDGRIVGGTLEFKTCAGERPAGVGV